MLVPSWQRIPLNLPSDVDMWTIKPFEREVWHGEGKKVENPHLVSRLSEHQLNNVFAFVPVQES